MIKLSHVFLAVFIVTAAFAPGLQAQDAAVPAKTETLVFGEHAIAKGDQVIRSLSATSKRRIKVSRGEEVLSDRSGEWITKITMVCTATEVSKGRIQSATLFFKKVTIDRKEDARQQTAPSETSLLALEGKTFFFDLTKTPWKIRTPDGEDVAEAEAKTVRERVTNLDGRFTGFDVDLSKTIKTGPMKIGTKLDLSSTIVADLLNMTQDDSVGKPEESLSGSLTLTGTRTVLGTKCAVFELQTKLDAVVTEARGKTKVFAEPKGEMLVGLKDKRVYRANYQGDIRIDGKMGNPHDPAASMVMEGRGTLKSARGNTYLKDKSAPKKP